MSRKLLAVLLCACVPVVAQSERGNITGIITDPAGAAVAGADLTVISRDTNAATKVTTTSSGEYNVPNLPPGVYRIEITAPGSRDSSSKNVHRRGGQFSASGCAAPIRPGIESIEVSTAAISLQTDNAKVSTQVQNKLVDELPLVVGGEMRSPFNLVAIAPEARGSGQSLSLGGGQAASWDATLDGHSVGTNRSGDTAEAAFETHRPSKR